MVLGLTLFILILGIMYIGADFLTPLVWGFFINLASIRFLENIQKKTKMKWGILSGIFLILLFSLIAGILFFFAYEIRQILVEIPQIDKKIEVGRFQLMNLLGGMGIEAETFLEGKSLQKAISGLSSYLFSFASNVGQAFGDLTLIFVYSFLFLFYKDLLPKFFSKRLKDPSKVDQAKGVIVNVMDISSNYLSGTMIMTAIMGLMLYISFLFLGLEYALFFSIFVAVMNLIPYLGNLIALVAVFAITFLITESIFYSPPCLGDNNSGQRYSGKCVETPDCW